MIFNQNNSKVIALSPHPDDVEFSASGMMMKMSYIDFINITLSSGGDFDNTTRNNSRLDEVSEFWKNIDNVSNLNLNIKHIKNLFEDELVNKIENLVDTSQVNFILTPPYEDTHFEHRIINHVAYGISRKNKLGLIEYQTPSTKKTWVPNLTIDVTEFYDTKCTRLKAFKSQKERHYFNDDVMNNFHKDFNALKRGIEFVEQYKIKSLFLD